MYTFERPPVYGDQELTKMKKVFKYFQQVPCPIVYVYDTTHKLTSDILCQSQYGNTWHMPIVNKTYEC